MIARNWLVRTVYYNNDFEIFEKDWMAWNVYYPDDFEAHKNLSQKQFPISVYYFMDGAVPHTVCDKLYGPVFFLSESQIQIPQH